MEPSDRFPCTVERFPDREYVVDDRGNRHTYSQVDVLSSSDCFPFKGIWGLSRATACPSRCRCGSEFAVIAMGCLKVGGRDASHCHVLRGALI